MSEAPDTGTATRRLAWPEALIGAAVLALAGIVAWQTGEIRVSPIYARVGPTVVPYVTAAGLGLLGVLLVVAALRGGWQPDEEKQAPIDRPALAWVVGGLVANVVLIGPAGFTIASAIMFAMIARGFGSRRIAFDLGIGALFALIAYLGFATTLGIDIGAGPVETALNALLGRGGN